MKILIAITGASSTELGLLLLQNLEKLEFNGEIYAILSKGAKQSFLAENKDLKLNENKLLSFFKDKFELEKTHFFEDDNLATGLSSGSFGIEKTIIAPCSINTLAKISNSLADTLITRAAAVALKEQKKLILAVREMPFSALSLEQMSKLSKLGVIIAPPVYASYFGIKNLHDLQNFIIGKWLDLLDIKHNLYKRWQ